MREPRDRATIVPSMPAVPPTAAARRAYGFVIVIAASWRAPGRSQAQPAVESLVSRAAARRRHGARRPPRHPARPRRPSRRRRLHPRRAVHRLHPAGAARGRAGHREDRGLDLLRRRQPLRRGALLGQPSRARGGQRAAPRQRQHPRQREHHLRHRHLPRSPQRLLLPDQPARRAARHDGDRRPAELGLERHLVRAHRALRARLDGRGLDSVQDAALPRQRPADLGHSTCAGW